MTVHTDHHVIAVFSCAMASLELISTQPETDVICELRDILELQFDVLDCIIHSRHYGSDGLDDIIEKCNSVVTQVKEFEDKDDKA